MICHRGAFTRIYEPLCFVFSATVVHSREKSLIFPGGVFSSSGSGCGHMQSCSLEDNDSQSGGTGGS